MKVIFIGLDAGDVHLNLNDGGVDAIHRCPQGLIKHEVLRPQTGSGAVRKSRALSFRSAAFSRAESAVSGSKQTPRR
jgi:hypothetical protein